MLLNPPASTYIQRMSRADRGATGDGASHGRGGAKARAWLLACFLPGSAFALDGADCYRELLRRGVLFEPVALGDEHPPDHPELTCHIDQPVRLFTPIHGVDLVYVEDGMSRPLLLSCDAALSLVDSVMDVRLLGVTRVLHMGAYNCRTIANRSSISTHAGATAIDISGFEFADGTRFTMENDWEVGTSEPRTEPGVFLWKTIHRWFDSHVWAHVLTPNFDGAHGNHVHLDVASCAHVLDPASDFCDPWDPTAELRAYSTFGHRVALTFDDGPNSLTTPLILDILRRHRVPAAFFINGERARGEMERAILKDIASDPTLVLGNHTWSHPKMTEVSRKEAALQVDRTTGLLRDAGASPRYFRFPFGAYTMGLLEAVRSSGYTVIPWHADSADWCFSRGDGVCKADVFAEVPDRFRQDMPGYVLHRIRQRDGGILLLHDIYRNTALRLEEILQVLEAEGYSFTRVDDARTFLDLDAAVDAAARPPNPPPSGRVAQRASKGAR